MTVKELHDYLEWYMREGDGDVVLNDVDADQKNYEDRCNREVVLVDDGMSPRGYNIKMATGTHRSRPRDDGNYSFEDIVALVFDRFEPEEEGGKC